MNKPPSTSKPDKIVLTGFMGTGKSTVGQQLAGRLGWALVDTDALIVERAGMSIPEIFAGQGEAAFRGLEAEIALEVSELRDVVIATGGGMLVSPHNLEALKRRALIICLVATPEEIERRLGDGEGRPLAANWRELLESRREAYARAGHQIDTTGRSPQAIIEDILSLWHKST